MKNFIKEFKEFALQGSMMDLAIGMIIGAAFTSIVGSLVNDIINPVIGIFTGKIDFSQLFIELDGQTYASLDAAEEAGAAVLKYGSFISNIINFVITALVVFLIIKVINTIRNKTKKEEAEEVTTKVCPYCQAEISILATRCPYCTSILEIEDMKPDAPNA